MLKPPLPARKPKPVSEPLFTSGPLPVRVPPLSVMPPVLLIPGPSAVIVPVAGTAILPRLVTAFAVVKAALKVAVAPLSFVMDGLAKLTMNAGAFTANLSAIKSGVRLRQTTAHGKPGNSSFYRLRAMR